MCTKGCRELWEASPTLGTDLKIPHWDEELPEGETSKRDEVDRWRVQGELPVCPHCQGPARPWVRLLGSDPQFDEVAQERKQAQAQVLRRFTNDMKEKAHSDKIKVICLELGCGLGAREVRIELEKVMEMFPSAKYIRINPEEDSTFPRPEWAHRTVSVTDGIDQAFAAIHTQVKPQAMDLCRFVVKDRLGFARDAFAPTYASPQRLLYIMERAGLTYEYDLNEAGRPTESEVQVFMPTTSTPEYVDLWEPLPNKSFCRPSIAMQKRGVIKDALASFQFLHVRFKTEGHSPNVVQNIVWCRGVLEDLLAAFKKMEVQEALKKKTDRKGVADVVKSVQKELQKHGLGTEEHDLLCVQWKMWFYGFLNPENESLAAEALSFSRVRICGLLPWKVTQAKTMKGKDAKVAKAEVPVSPPPALPPGPPEPVKTTKLDNEVVEVVEIADESPSPQIKRRGSRPKIEAQSLLAIAKAKAAATKAAEVQAAKVDKAAAKAAAREASKLRAKAKAEAKAKLRAAAKERARARAEAQRKARAEAKEAKAEAENIKVEEKVEPPKAPPTSMGPPPVPAKAKARFAKRKAEAVAAPGSPEKLRRGAVVQILEGERQGLTGVLEAQDEANHRWQVAGDFGKEWFAASNLAFPPKQPGTAEASTSAAV